MEQGRRTALLDADTEGVLALRLGNLGPGESILVSLGWVGLAEESGGLTRLRFPTAIAPRYFPPRWDDGSDVTKRELLDLPWTNRLPFGINVEIEILDHEDLAGIASPSHAVSVDLSARPVRVRLGGDLAALDRDFILEVAHSARRADRAWIEADEAGTWIAVDAAAPLGAGRGPRSVAFLLDISGSMQGSSLSAAARSLKAALGALDDGDSFGVFAFNQSVLAMSGARQMASPEAASAARAWIDSLQASGGTELEPALGAVYAADSWDEVLVLTDGAVGNEEDIARLVATQRSAKGVRTSLLGIGMGPAGDVLARIARAGGGGIATVNPGDSIEARALTIVGEMLRFRLESPTLRSGELEAELAASGSSGGASRLKFFGRLPPGTAAGGQFSFAALVDGQTVSVSLEPCELSSHAGTGFARALWSRGRITDMLDRAAASETATERRRLEKAAVKLSCEAGVLSTVASMVLVDQSDAPVNGRARRIDIPVLVPAGYHGGKLEQRGLFQCQDANACRMPMFLRSQSAIVSEGRSMPLGSCDLSEPDPLFELLALQVPGGGFSSPARVLRLLCLEERVGAILDTARLSTLAESKERGAKLAALVLAWLELKEADRASIWEPLVAPSRALVARCEAARLAGNAHASLAEWAKQRLARAEVKSE